MDAFPLNEWKSGPPYLLVQVHRENSLGKFNSFVRKSVLTFSSRNTWLARELSSFLVYNWISLRIAFVIQIGYPFPCNHQITTIKSPSSHTFWACNSKNVTRIASQAATSSVNGTVSPTSVEHLAKKNILMFVPTKNTSTSHWLTLHRTIRVDSNFTMLWERSMKIRYVCIKSSKRWKITPVDSRKKRIALRINIPNLFSLRERLQKNHGRIWHFTKKNTTSFCCFHINHTTYNTTTCFQQASTSH